jgi:predicted  nucleic acid-binding Zn-ribbon protein
MFNEGRHVLEQKLAQERDKRKKLEQEQDKLLARVAQLSQQLAAAEVRLARAERDVWLVGKPGYTVNV